jgi:hypothetical protein
MQKEKGAASSAAGIIGGLQAINVLIVVECAEIFMRQKSYFTKTVILAVAIFFQITTYIRYVHKGKNSFLIVEQRWLTLKENQRYRVRIFSFLYIFFSVLFFFGLAIYLGSKK